MVRNLSFATVVWLWLWQCSASLSRVSLSGRADDCQTRGQCVLSKDVGPRETTAFKMPTYKLAWDGVAATDAELISVSNLRAKAEHEARNISRGWLYSVSDVELLRFLRAKHGHESEAWDMLLAHVVWRNSDFGADSNFTRNFFNSSPLHHEVFWLGLNKENCPTLVVRTQIHDGIYYNEDPRVFTR
jgi:hypothetical protein